MVSDKSISDEEVTCAYCKQSMFKPLSAAEQTELDSLKRRYEYPGLTGKEYARYKNLGGEE